MRACVSHAAIALTRNTHAPHPHPKPRSGDPSAAFALSAFFPATLAPAVDRASGVCARTLRLVTEPTVVSADMLGGAPLSEEAARRRWVGRLGVRRIWRLCVCLLRYSCGALLHSPGNAAHARLRNGLPTSQQKRRCRMWRLGRPPHRRHLTFVLYIIGRHRVNAACGVVCDQKEGAERRGG